MKFETLNLVDPILKALKSKGYTEPTPIQEQAIPHVLEGKDILGCAQTGTGKTAAFSIPIIQHIYEQQMEALSQKANQTEPIQVEQDECKKAKPNGKNQRKEWQKKSRGKGGKRRPIQSLILSPTRELALQISDSIGTYARYTDVKRTVIYGGVSKYKQIKDLQDGVDILVATPGRLLDLMDQGHIKLNHVKVFVLDEADHMLDMGFAPDVERIIARLPEERQSLLFSATMPTEILRMVDKVLKDPVKIQVSPESMPVELIQQKVFMVNQRDKNALLVDLLKKDEMESVLIFSRTKHGADKIVKDLHYANIPAGVIHGNKSQRDRQMALRKFKSRQTRVLVATDIAARGVDISGLSHVINYNLPDVPETYVHRIGRTGRAGLGGIAFTFCDNREKKQLRDIQRLVVKKIPIDHVDGKSLTHQSKPITFNEEKAVVGGEEGSRSGNRSGSRNGRPWNKDKQQSTRSEGRKPWNKDKKESAGSENKKPWNKDQKESQKSGNGKPWYKAKKQNTKWDSQEI